MDGRQLFVLCRDRVHACQASGLEVKDYCKLHGINTKCYYYSKLRIHTSPYGREENLPCVSPTDNSALPTAPAQLDAPQLG